MNRFASRFVPALALALSASRAVAQDCSVAEDKPSDLAKATLAFSLAGAAAPDARAAKLKSAMQLLTDKADKIGKENPLGLQLVRGEIYSAWLSTPNVKPMMRKADLGEGKDTTSIDVLAAADAAFRAVEAGAPDCVAYVKKYRRTQVWADLVNGGFAQLNAGNVDSAEKLITRSQLADAENPYAYSALASIAAARNNATASADFYRKAIAAAATDTSFLRLRLQSLYQLGQTLETASGTATGADKTKMLKEAADSYHQYITLAPLDPDAPVVGNALASVLMSMGDTASIPPIYADQLAHPTKYGDIALVTSGVVASMSNHSKDAAQLFESSLAVNAYNRDALSNLAASYHALGQFDKMVPIVGRLVALDPSNPDNWLLYAYAYNGQYMSAKTPAAKKIALDSVTKYNKMSEEMPVRLSLSLFSRGRDKTVLAGSIENRGKTPMTYNLKIDFLDGSGAVVDSQSTSVQVAPGKAESFRVESAKGGVAGFRYAPLT